MKKHIAVLMAFILVIVSLVACGQTPKETTAPEQTTSAVAEDTTTEAPAETTEGTDEPAEVVEKGTVKIGHLLDITGTEAITGAQAQAAFNFDLEVAHQLTGWTFEVEEGDCQSDSSKAATAALAMVEDGCKAIFGPTQGGHKAAVAGALEDRGVPLILYNGSPMGMTLGSNWIVAPGGSMSTFPSVIADYAYNELGYRKVWTIRQGTTGGDNMVLPFEVCFKAMGGEILGSEYVPMGTSDWSSYMTTIINSDAEAIVGWTSSADAIAFYKGWYDSGAYKKVPIVATMHGGFTDFYIMNALNNAGYEDCVNELMNQGLIAPISYCYSIDSKENQEFVEIWKEGHDGQVPGGNNLAGSCLQALLLLANALDAVGADASPEELRDALLAADFHGPEGHTYFNEGQCVAYKDVYVVKAIKLDDGSYNYEVLKTYSDVKPEGYNYDVLTDSYTK